jgi:hypothetical protein
MMYKYNVEYLKQKLVYTNIIEYDLNTFYKIIIIEDKLEIEFHNHNIIYVLKSDISKLDWIYLSEKFSVFQHKIVNYIN